VLANIMEKTPRFEYLIKKEIQENEIGLKDGIIHNFLSVLERSEVKDRIKKSVSPLLYMFIREIFPYIVLSFILIIVNFIMVIIILVVVLRKENIFSGNIK
jgi:hypothetical protein